jgi:hypothetical protein
MELGDFDEAVQDYERALKMDSSQGKIPPRSKGQGMNILLISRFLMQCIHFESNNFTYLRCVIYLQMCALAKTVLS